MTFIYYELVQYSTVVCIVLLEYPYYYELSI